MVSDKIQNAHLALATLAGAIPEPLWLIVKCAQAELKDAAEQARQMENNFLTPGGEDTANA